MKRLLIALCVLFLVTMVTYADINVNYNDLGTFKVNFVANITHNLNVTGVSDASVYKYIIAAINSAWDTYSTYSFYLYSEADDESNNITLKAYSELFDTATVKLIEIQSKARIFKAIYSSMNDFDLSYTTEPQWILICLQDAEDEVIYLLEVNVSSVNNLKLEEHVVDLLGKLVYMEDSFYSVLDEYTFTLILATYVAKYDEIVVDILFTDAKGNLYGEAVLTRNNIFGKLF